MFDPVPWMVGGGAVHSVNVARNIAYAAFGGRPGIINPTDLEVRELAVPGNKVRVFPGTVAIKNLAVGTRDEMYVGRMPTEDQVSIASTTSSGGRSDLVVARVENPFEAGESWAEPADHAVGPYIFTRVISNVPASTTTADQLGLGQSMIALARVDLPASTGTITQSMITDLRSLSTVLSQRDFNITAQNSAQNLTSTEFVNWPNASNLSVMVPDWATNVRLRVIISGVLYGQQTPPSNIWGSIRLALVGAVQTGYTQTTSFNVSVAGGEDRATFMAGAPSTGVVAGNRGKPASIHVEAQRLGGSGTMTADSGTTVSVEAEFFRQGESNV